MYDIDKFKNVGTKILSPTYQMHSSVVLPVIEITGEDHILFELRNSKLKHQPGEVSFPGGRVEKDEESRAAAIREFCEEIEAEESQLEIISRIFEYATPTRGLIHCYLARIDKNIDLSISNDEVERLFTVPISFFKDQNPLVFKNASVIVPDEKLELSGLLERLNIPLKGEESYSWPTLYYDIPFYEYEEFIIWGITANMVRNFVEML